MIRSYLEEEGATLNMVRAFLNPPNEPPLSDSTIRELFQAALLEAYRPTPERIAELQRLLGI